VKIQPRSFCRHPHRPVEIATLWLKRRTRRPRGAIQIGGVPRTCCSRIPHIRIGFTGIAVALRFSADFSRGGVVVSALFFDGCKQLSPWRRTCTCPSSCSRPCKASSLIAMLIVTNIMKWIRPPHALRVPQTALPDAHARRRRTLSKAGVKLLGRRCAAAYFPRIQARCSRVIGLEEERPRCDRSRDRACYQRPPPNTSCCTRADLGAIIASFCTDLPGNFRWRPSNAQATAKLIAFTPRIKHPACDEDPSGSQRPI